jgi:hypothetical protein
MKFKVEPKINEGTTYFKLTDDNGEICLIAIAPNGYEETIAYIDEDGVLQLMEGIYSGFGLSLDDSGFINIEK